MYFDIFQKLTLLKSTLKSIYHEGSGGVGQKE